MREDEIYINSREFLIQTGWVIIGGQPPRGTDRYPVIEIKSDANERRGSAGSFKPDLVATQDGFLLICECKPSFDPKDVEKLHAVLTSTSRIEQLHLELSRRKITAAGNQLIAVVSFSGLHEFNDELVGSISLTQVGAIVGSANCWSDEVRSLFGFG